MKFKKNSSNGKAGEHYFAYWISRHFTWPCRILDIDVGIDAQVEIFDEHNHSTGDFIAVQIKTSQGIHPNVSIDLDNLNYWASIEDIVILISICLGYKEPKIYWKVINDNSIQNNIELAKTNSSYTTTIQFDEQHLLTENHKLIFSQLPYKGNIGTLNKKIAELIDLTNEINEIFPTEDNIVSFSLTELDNFDYLSIEHYIHKLDSACFQMDEINKIVSSAPKISSFAKNLSSAKSSFDLSILNMGIFISCVYEIDSDHAYETGKTWKNSSTHKIVLNLFDEHYLI